MSDERTLAVRAALNEGAGAAEKQLALIAGSQGDDQLALVVAELSAPEIVTIVGESDMTKSSLVSAFATPEQFIAVLTRKLDGWSSYYGSMSLGELANSLPGLQDQLEDFLCPMIFAAESADREKAIFDALLDFKIELAGLVGFLVCVVFGPLLVFTPQLAQAKRTGSREYGTLAQRYVREFDVKWLRGDAPAGEPLLGSADVQSLADLGNSFEVVRSMRVFPITRDGVVQLAAATLVPVLPLALTMMSFEELVKKLFSILF